VGGNGNQLKGKRKQPDYAVPRGRKRKKGKVNSRKVLAHDEIAYDKATAIFEEKKNRGGGSKRPRGRKSGEKKVCWRRGGGGRRFTPQRQGNLPRGG